MKKILILLGAVVVLSLAACKTNEVNYRDAYLKAKEKQTETGDSLTTTQLRQADMPRMMKIGNDMLPTRTFAVGGKVDSGNEEGLRKFCIVVGKFRQIFNADQMCKRLQADGYADACVLHDRDKYYFVIASSTNVATDVAAMLAKVSDDKNLVLRDPYPYVLRPAHLVR